MKKIYFAVTLLLSVVAVSCQREASFDDKEIGENALVLSMQGSASTRAADEVSVQKGTLIELTDAETSQKFVFEETIEDLNSAWAPATKGTPVYTENVGVLYEKMIAHVGSSNYDFYSMDNEEGKTDGSMVAGGWRYQCSNFTGWPADATDATSLDFYLLMPTTGNGISGTPTYGKTGNDLSIEFNYQSETTAAAQKDLILAARTITKKEAMDNRVNGVSVLFNHALTGVKFAIANYDASKKITIKSISFNGLYDGGKCTIIPAKENNYRDKPTEEYSSSDGRVAWPNANLTKSGKALKAGEFGAPVNYSGGSFSKNGKYPSSFSDKGATNNLNDGDATQTFWLIPQTMSDDVTLTIEYTCGSETTKTGVFEFGKALKTASGYVEWKAGELRTYTIKVDDVNVSITDQFTTSTKNNVVITNTGATEAYIRAAIIGQWVDPSGNPVFGYTDFKTGDESGQPATIPSWYQDYTSGGTYYGTFVGLPGDDWVKGSDGYYYYTKPVASGAPTTPLFTSYTINDKNRPIMKVGGKPTPTNLLIDIATQAIAAKQKGSGDKLSYIPYDEAWKNAKDVASKAQTLTVN